MKIDADASDAKESLGRVIARTGDLTPIMRAFGNHMMSSVRENFSVGGRPTWDEPKFEVTPLVMTKDGKRRVGRGRRAQGRKKMGGLLVLSGDLRSSITFDPQPADLVLVAAPEEDPVKAPVHQWGVPDTAHGGSGRLAGRGNTVAIPARPYLVFQPEDIVFFRDLVAGWIRVGSGGA